VTVVVVFARGELLPLVPSLDADHDGFVLGSEVLGALPDLERVVLGGIHVNADGVPCEPTLDEAKPVEQDGLLLRGRYACKPGFGKIAVDVALLDDLSHGHRHVAHAVSGADTVDVVCFRGQASFELIADATARRAPTATHGAWAFLRMGLEHILTGYDHLVFLFGLVLVGGRVRSLIGVITAFTLAHSITLALAALDVWAPSPRYVEPLIALSIAYVGVENFFATSAEKRWRITFPFGLIHGFGFAGALRAIELPRAAIPTALVLFNLGVELGQLGVMAIVLPVILRLRKEDWFKDRGVKILSALIAALGLVWFVLRLLAAR